MPEAVGRSNYKPVLNKLKQMDMLAMNNTNNDGSYRPSYRLYVNSKSKDSTRPTGFTVTGYAVSRRLLEVADEADIERVMKKSQIDFDSLIY